MLNATEKCFEFPNMDQHYLPLIMKGIALVELGKVHTDTPELEEGIRCLE